MSALPDALTYYASTLVGLSRNTIELSAQGATNLSTAGTRIARFTFPNSSIVDLRSFAVQADCKAIGVPLNQAFTGCRALIPAGGLRTMIERCSVSCGGVALTNDTAPLGVIAFAKDNLQKSIAKAWSDDRVLANGEIEPGPATADSGQERVSTATNLLGFMEAEPRYLDCSLIPQLYVQLTLADPTNLPVRAQSANAQSWQALGENTGAFDGSTACQFEANNLKATIDVISIASGTYQQLIADLIAERGSLVIPYRAYNAWEGEGTATATIRGSLSTANLHKVWCVARCTESDADTTFKHLTMPTVHDYTQSQIPVKLSKTTGDAFVQQSCNFTGMGVGSWQLRVNNSPYPLFQPDVFQTFAMACNAEDRLGETQHGCLVTSQTEWLGSKHAQCVRFSLDNDLRRLSGLDVSSINAALTMTLKGAGAAEGGGVTRNYLMVAESTSRLMIGAGRTISVVY